MQWKVLIHQTTKHFVGMSTSISKKKIHLVPNARNWYMHIQQRLDVTRSPGMSCSHLVTAILHLQYGENK